MGVGLFESKVELEIVEPRDFEIHALRLEFLREVLVAGAEKVGIGSVVVGDENSVFAHADVAFQTEEEIAGEWLYPSWQRAVPSVGGVDG
jgi:hypothetical protein